MADFWAVVEAQLTSSSAVVREDTLERAVAWARKEDNMDPYLAQCARIINSTLTTYRDQRSRTAVESLIAALCEQSTKFKPSFAKFLSGTVKKRPFGVGKGIAFHTQITLIRWTCVLLESGFSPQEKTWSGLISAAAVVVESLLYAPDRVSHGVYGRLVRALNKDEETFPALVTKIAESEDGGMAGMAGLVLKQAGVSESAMGSLSIYFSKVLLGGKAKPSIEQLQCFVPLVEKMTCDEFMSGPWPAVERLLKRSPETAVGYLAFIVASLQCDLSSVAAAVSSPLLMFLRDERQDRREAAVLAIASLAKGCADGTVVEGIITDVSKVLGGSKGANPYWYQRAGPFTLLGDLARADVAPAAVAAILSGLRKEKAHDEARFSALVSLATAVSLCDTLPAGVVEAYANGMSSAKTKEEASRGAALQSLCSAITPGNAKEFAPLIAPLSKIVSEGTQPAKYSDGVYAAAVLATLSGNDDLDKQIEEAGAWTILVAPDSFLFAARKSVSPPGVCLAQGTAGALLRRLHPARVVEAGATSALASTLVGLLVNASWEVRRATVSKIQELTAACSDVCSELIAVLDDCLTARAEDLPVYMRATVAQTAVQTCVRGATGLDDSAYLRIVRAASHPVIAGTQARSHVLLKKIGKHGDEVPAGVLAASPFICAALEDEWKSEDADARRRALFTTRALACLPWSAPAYFSPLVERAVGCLDVAAFQSVSEKQWQIYRTPEGKLLEEAIAEAEAEREASQRRKKATADDDDWEREAAAKKNKKKGGKKGKGGSKADKAALEERQAALSAEADVRRHVGSLVARHETALLFIRACAQSNKTATHDALKYIVPAILANVKVAAVASVAMDTEVALAEHCLSHPLGGGTTGFLIASAIIRMTCERNAPSEWKREALNKHIARLVAVVAAAVGSRVRLSAPTVAFIMPALERVLMKDTNPPSLHEQAFKVISSHTSSGTLDTELPRESMTRCLIHTLESLPFLEKAARAALVALWTDRGHMDIRPLLRGIMSGSMAVRAITLSALQAAGSLRATGSDAEAVGRETALMLWVACQDFPEKKKKKKKAKKDDDDDDDGDELNNAEAARALWEEHALALPQDYTEDLLDKLAAPEPHARLLVGRALALAMEEVAGTEHMVDSMLARYDHIIDLSTAVREIDYSKAYDDEVEDEAELSRRLYVRSGTACALSCFAGHLKPAHISSVFTFLLSRGLADDVTEVRVDFQNAGVQIISEQGADSVGLLFPIFEEEMTKPTTNEKEDLIREGLVVFLGSMAKHLSKEDPKVVSTLEKLLEALLIPSAAVQVAVARCLPGLVPAIKADAGQYIDLLIERLLTDPNYGHRKGAAHGLAGLVKGLTLSSLKQYKIMERLEEAIENGNPDAREGALLAFEAFSITLGRLFEPYVVHIMGHLLDCFGDSSQEVRQATIEACKAIMEQLTGRGVKLVLPMLLDKLGEKGRDEEKGKKGKKKQQLWRTKQGGVEILGTMAYCAPKQLSQCLPAIAPQLIKVLADTHVKVAQAARAALENIGSVIKNPEIQVHVQIILEALKNPSKSTEPALEALLYTSFVHRIDAASLALIVPILHRGLKERSTETKKKAGRIVGNMCTLTDRADLLHYLPLLLPELKKVLVDPIPEVRSVAARALGSLVNGMGEEHFEDLIPWLIETLKSDAGSVERSGAAQGLSEVLGGLGVDHFQRMLPELVANSNHQIAIVREGFFNIFVFMPPILEDEFQPFIGDVLPCVLRGLADEAEFVRDTAFRAGQVLVNNFGATSLTLLLPALEDGLFDDNWRIRQSSVSLLGDLLYMISGVTGNIQVNEEDSDDEGLSSEAQGKAIIKVLGEEKRARVLSSLYMARLDVQAIVRQAALQVWKQIVSHTPRTLREILPVLMDNLIAHLASANPDKRQVAGRTLGDVVKKLGDRVLPDIIPILEHGLDDSDADNRQGVCLGLSEVMASAGKAQTTLYIDALLPAVRKALCDTDEDVREAAAQAFDILYGNVGFKALDDILPKLLADLEVNEDEAGEGEEGEDEEDASQAANALDGLRQILSVRASDVLPYLIPKLITPPLTVFNCRALTALAEVGGANIPRHLTAILPPLLDAIANGDEETKATAANTGRAVVLSVPYEGVHILMRELQVFLKDGETAGIRASTAQLVGDLFAAPKYPLDDHVQPLLKCLLNLLNDRDLSVCKAALRGIEGVCGSVRKDDQAAMLPFIRKTIRRIREDHPLIETLPGFNLPKALDSLLPIFQQGLMYGTPEMREAAALGIGELIDLVEDKMMRGYIKSVAGPLIRIIGDRFVWEVKAAILATLCLLIKKAGMLLKPFVPQLQTTLIKALVDPTKIVRKRASTAIGLLTPLHSRVDQLMIEISKQLAANEDPAIRRNMLSTMAGVMRAAGKKVTEKSRGAVRPVLLALIDDPLVQVRVGAASAVGALLINEPAETAGPVLDEVLNARGKSQMHGCTASIAAVLKENPAVLEERADETSAHIVAAAKDAREDTRQAAAIAAGRVLDQPWGQDFGVMLIPLLGALAADHANDVKVTALGVIKSLAKSQPELTCDNLSILVPPLVALVKDRSVAVKHSAERALIYTLQLPMGEDTLDGYVASAGGKAGKDCADYCRRVLLKVVRKPDYESDEEPEDDL